MPLVIRQGRSRTDQATPVQAAPHGQFTADLLSDPGHLSQFGAFTETLAPGDRGRATGTGTRARMNSSTCSRARRRSSKTTANLSAAPR